MRGLRIAQAVAVLALVLGAVACTPRDAGGGVATAAGAAPTSGTRTDAPADWRAWAGCMRENGIPMPDPDPATGQIGARFDKRAPAFARAVAACRSLEPASDSHRNDPLSPAELAQMRQWSQCMRAHQVPVPDPDPDEPNGPQLGGLAPANVTDAALTACRDQLPARVRGTG